MGTTLLSIIGSLIVFMLGLLLYLVKSARNDIEKLEVHVVAELKETEKEILKRVCKEDCNREMKDVKEVVKESVRDIRALERGR
jgi:hypothetical protein